MDKCYRVFVIVTALGEVGYKEKKSNIDLYDPDANAGSGNYNKYAYEIDTKYPSFYNGRKNGYSWCDVYNDWCFIVTYGEDKARKMLYQPIKSSGAGCLYSMRYYIRAGEFYSMPEIGDQIFFGTRGNTSSSTHTGIVVKVDGKKVYTVEGNSKNAVRMCSYKLTDKTIIGYGRPAYDPDPISVELPVIKKGVKSGNVAYMQAALIVLGYDVGSTGVDGSFGGKTDAAVRAFQKDKKLTVDGVCGPKTWAKICELLK